MTFLNPQTKTTVDALSDINFSLKKGELLAVLGPSGCGKTTLLNMIAGFLEPTKGKIFLGDEKITGPGLERGMVFQQGALFEWLSVGQHTGIELTENCAMWPPSSVSGFYFGNEEAKYFPVSRIDRDQVTEYAQRKEMTQQEAEKWLAPVLGYTNDFVA